MLDKPKSVLLVDESGVCAPDCSCEETAAAVIGWTRQPPVNPDISALS